MSRIPAALLGAALAAAGCGGGASASVDGGGFPDSAASADGGISCEMAISFSPASPQAPGSVLVDGSIFENGLVGMESYQFEVSFDGHPIAFEERDPFDGSKIAFPTAEIGPYRVALYGGVGGFYCIDALTTINVTDPAANLASYRLRFVPAAGQLAPVQERVIQVPGGADYSLGGLSLDNGVSASGTVHDASATPLPGYLRLTRTGAGQEVLETFADAGGGFHARLGTGPYEVLVVPESTAVAPERRTDVTLAGLADLTLSDGDTVTGTVTHDGAPVVGATVALRVAGVPSTVATTSDSGQFTVRARGGGATAVTVSPVPGDGLPRLDVAPDDGLVVTDGSDLVIDYPVGSSRSVSLVVTGHDGETPAPGSRVTWIARPLADAATLTAGGDPLAVRGGLRRTSVADGDGTMVATGLPEAVYDVVIEPDGMAGEEVSLLVVDLTSGTPSPTGLSLSAPATVQGTVTAGAVGIGGVEVTAVPRGLLANVAGGSAYAVSAGDGSFSLSVVAGGEYDLWFDPGRDDVARGRVPDVTAPAAGAALTLPEVGLTGAVAVTGQLSIPGGGNAAGVAVMALCSECDGLDARIPVAETATDYNGRFRLAIPDPGLAEARARVAGAEGQ